MGKGKDAKPHIGIFGRRNNGKSSLINALAGQEIAIVSDYAGTTTDPVKRSFEIEGIGPTILIDTAGIDDAGDLGQKRIDKTRQVIEQVDLAVLVLTGNSWGNHEAELATAFIDQDIPFLIVHNKEDKEQATSVFQQTIRESGCFGFLRFSTLQPKDYVDGLVSMLRVAMPETAYKKKTLLGDLVAYGDVVLFITPIDIEAPEGRLILPQIQAIRDVLDNDCVAIVLKEREVDSFLRKSNLNPALAVTDSQIFLKADGSVPSDIPLTSFSILLARMKGDFQAYLKGTPSISQLKDGDRVLLLESCSHHVSCDDIGRVKIPRWISSFTGKQLQFDVVPGLNKLDRAITDYALVIQCGGCVVTQKQLKARLRGAKDNEVAVTNYGMAIAYVQGIYDRAVAPFTGGAKAQIDYL